MLRSVQGVAVALLILAPACAARAGEPFALTFVGRQRIPAFSVDGRPTRIHSQGLWVDDAHLYVTGRLETTPRRALLIRISRADPRRVETLDLMPAGTDGDDARLDHPGGFDCDGEAFWIPVSESRRHSHTAIVRVAYRPDRPLAQHESRVAFRVDDHIGALALDRERNALVGANWDTEVVHVWKRDGTVLERIARDALVQGDSDWILAVQDWKSVGKGRILAGGLDKSPRRDPTQPRAVIELLDLRRRRRLARTRLAGVDGFRGHLTNEGLAVVGRDVYLLPGDLGIDAELFHFRMVGAGLDDRR